MFSNREIAIGIWLAVAGVVSLALPRTRKFLFNVNSKRLVQLLFSSEILWHLCAVTVHVSIVLILMHALGLWYQFAIKDAVIWFILVGLPTLFHFAGSQDEGTIFRRIIRDNIKALIVVEFLVGRATLPLLWELILLLVGTFLVLAEPISSVVGRFNRASRFALPTAVLLGCIVFFVSVYASIGSLDRLALPEAFLPVLLPPLLSVGLAPFVYLVVLRQTYHLLFIRLQCTRAQNASVLRYSKWRFITTFGLRVISLRNFWKMNAKDLLRASTKADFDEILARPRR